MNQHQEKILRLNRWDTHTDSKWNLIGKAGTTFGFKFLDIYSKNDIKNFILLLITTLDDKMTVVPVGGKILFKTTLRQYSEIFGYKKLSSAIVRMDELTKSGLVSVKKLSDTKGVPSEYYLHCPATVAITKLGLSKTKYKSTNDSGNNGENKNEKQDEPSKHPFDF